MIIPNIKQSKGTDAVMIIGALLIAFILYKVISGMGGVIDSVKGLAGNSEADKKAEAEINAIVSNLERSGAANPFNVQMINNLRAKGVGFATLPLGTIDKAVEQIRNSVGVFSDNPLNLISALKNAVYQTQVAQIAERFKNKTGNDLLSFIKEKFDTLEQKNALLNAIAYVKSLPSGNSGVYLGTNQSELTKLMIAIGKGDKAALKKYNDFMRATGGQTI